MQQDKFIRQCCHYVFNLLFCIFAEVKFKYMKKVGHQSDIIMERHSGRLI